MLRSPALLVVVAACASPQIVPRVAPGARLESITVTSPMFTEGGRVPIDQSCDGKDIVPELVLSAPPDKTKSLVILVDDPDASSSGSFTHFLAFNVAPDTRKIPSEPEPTGLGADARIGTNDFKAVRYSGPCPPQGEQHRYRYRVIAVDRMLKLDDGATRDQVDRALDGHILGEGILTAVFGH